MQAMSDEERRKAGIEILETLLGGAPRPGTLPDDFLDMTIDHVFGRVWARPGLELQERSMITLAALTVLGRENELRVHLRGALNLGIPKDKIIEILIHLAHYGGWPVAVSAMRIAKESFESFDKKKK
jgi:4-carboxymuconolactone decarboxylase